ncbi:MAG: PD-(D/E)XK nuclease family protein, partial [Psychroflexus sp.]|nr:PD-(D/E)XK nuclease family protein [Psychroflexus sp.]
MSQFLDDVIKQFDVNQLQESCFVFPSRRSANAFKRQMTQNASEEAFIFPEMLSVEEFIAQASGLNYIDSLETVFQLYDVYRGQTPKDEQESFETFYNWSQTLIQDFNELDRYLIDTAQFFNHLKDIKDVEHWSKATQKTQMVQNYLKFWEALPGYYQTLRHQLLEQKKAYQGLAYRVAAEQIETFANKKPTKFVFVGLNALNSAEIKIIRYLTENKQAQVFWDIDCYLLKAHKAGEFMRSYARTWPLYRDQSLKASTDNFSQAKDLFYYDVSKQIGQAKLVGQILAQLSEKKLKKTALVLGDENLLQPILNALPDNVKKANITMGLALSQTSFASFFEHILDWQKGENHEIYHQDIIRIVSHPMFKTLYFEQQKKLQNYLLKANQIYVSKENLFVIAQSISQDFEKHLRLVFQTYNDVNTFLKSMLELTYFFEKSYADDDVRLLYLRGFQNVFTKIITYNETTELITTFKTLKQIYKDILSQQTVDFIGDAYDGLQIMGMLETRVLSFERVIMTSVNEGVLPLGKTQNSYIPFDLKKQYNLPTYTEKDNVYAYHFFRLLQNPKEAHFVYNTDTEGMSKGEESRFLKQLEYFKRPQHKIQHLTGAADATVLKDELSKVEKTPEMLAIIKKRFEKGISASALTTYIRNPLDFYKRYVLSIREVEEIEDTVSYRVHGNVIHKTIENIYKQYLNEILSPQHLERILETYEIELQTQFANEFNAEAIQSGINLLNYQIAKQQTKRFLEQELKIVEKNELILKSLEAHKEVY